MEDALKMLRSRSFYLEIMTEHLVDELLGRLSLSRANLIFSGGGHALMLLPNTESIKAVLENLEKMAKEMGSSKSALISVALENYKKGQVK